MMKQKKKKPVYALLLLALPTAIITLTVIILMNWPILTHIEVDLTVSRAVFNAGGSEYAAIFNSIGFQSLTIEKFDRIVLYPEQVEVANPQKYIPIQDRYPKDAWQSLTITPPLEIIGEDETLQPVVTLESVKHGLNSTGIMDRILVRPGSVVTLEVSGTRAIVLTVKVAGQASSIASYFRQRFQLLTSYCRVTGIPDIPFSKDLLTYRIKLPDHSPQLEITGQQQALVLILTISPEETVRLFSKEGILINDLDFTRQNEKGVPVTTLLKDGEIIYPDYPKIEKVRFKATDFIGLDRLKKFRIEEMAIDPQSKGIHLRLHGLAGHIRTGSREFPKDHRLTCFDSLRLNPRLMVLLSIIIWVFPTTVGGYKLYRELKFNK